jgi:RNA polymerase sigma-70 factor (ECF subfamily)
MEPQQAFDQYHQAVFSFAYRLTRRQDLAEDLTQECFLALLRAPQRFDELRGSMKTYLFSIARNLALKQYRDYRAEEPLQGSEAGFEAPNRADPLAALEISYAVAEAVALLPQLQQEALVLFEYERFRLEEIAHIVGADTGTVKSRLHRARERLRRVLAPYRKVGNAHGTV